MKPRCEYLESRYACAGFTTVFILHLPDPAPFNIAEFANEAKAAFLVYSRPNKVQFYLADNPPLNPPTPLPEPTPRRRVVNVHFDSFLTEALSGAATTDSIWIDAAAVIGGADAGEAMDDLVKVFAHEVGHLAGIGHPQDPEAGTMSKNGLWRSVMFPDRFVHMEDSRRPVNPARMMRRFFTGAPAPTF